MKFDAFDNPFIRFLGYLAFALLCSGAMLGFGWLCIIAFHKLCALFVSTL